MRWKKLIIVAISIGLIVNLSGCNDDSIVNLEKINSEDIEGLVSPVEYPEAISFNDFDGKISIRYNNVVSEEYFKALNTFSMNTSSKLLNVQDRKANIMYSPISLYMSLALSASAADNKTQEEILSLLGMKHLGVDQLEEQTGNLFRLLYTDNEIGKLKLANSLWLDKDISFYKDYIDTATNNYYASLFSVDFSDEKTGDLISNWISENSNGTLKGNNPVNKDQIMTIINTIYFYDEWTNRFNENNTKEDIFYAYDGESVKCDFMNTTFGSHGFIDGKGYISSSLIFKNQGSMNFYLPDEGVDVYDLISTKEKVDNLLNRDNPSNIRKNGKVVYKIPKFKFGSTLKLKETLKSMGMERAFKSGADFTNLTDENIAYISDIMQSTHISIDEKGCEASAYTQIDYVGSAMPKDNAEMILDRPFIFTITSSNGVILFIGVINNPIME